MTAANYDEPRCNHLRQVHRVTNLADGWPLMPREPHASAWVCEKRPCVLDAMAWVERLTEQPALVYNTEHKLVQL